MELLLPLLIVFMVGMIFVSNRQRKKQAAQQESLQSALAVGDIVVMTSGISGTVIDVDDERTIDVEIAPEVVTTWLRAAVREKIGGEGVVAGPDVDTDVSGTLDAGSAPVEAVGDGAAEPRVTEPRVTEPRVTEPRVTEPRVTEPRTVESRTPEVPAPALEADRVSAGTEHTAEGTPSARPDEPSAHADEPSDTPSTSGARRP